jgi:hypothetical protein
MIHLFVAAWGFRAPLHQGDAVTKQPVTEPDGKYAIELCRPGGPDAGIEEVLDRHDNLTVARAILSGTRRTISGPCRDAVRTGREY